MNHSGHLHSTAGLSASVPFPGSPGTTYSQEAIGKARRFVNGICGPTQIIADNSNVFVGGKDRFRIEWGRAVPSALGGDYLVAKHFVASLPPGTQLLEERKGQVAFYDVLQRYGWQVHRHRAVKDTDGSVAENEIRVDGHVKVLIRKAAEDTRCLSIVLLSGDGGMTNAVKYARRCGKVVFVAAWNGTLNPALANAATDFAYLDDLRPFLARVAN